MNLHDKRNVQRVFRAMAADWNCPVGMVKVILQRTIDRNWEKAMLDGEKKALWDKYFPKGKPTPDQYILWLGRAHDKGEDVPYLLNK